MSILDSNSNAIERTRRLPWWPVMLCLFVLMLATISPADDFKVNQFGTASILPPVVLKLVKLVGRGLAVVVLTGCLAVAIQNPRFGKSIQPLLPMFAFVAFGFLSVVWSPAHMTSLVQSGSFAILLLLAWLISFNWSEEGDTSRILYFVSVVMMGISVGLLMLHFAVPQVGALTRDSSGLFHSTVGGSTASLALVTLFSCRMIWGWTWTKQLLVPGTLIHLAAMLVGANRLSLALAVLVCAAAFCLTSDIISIAVIVFCSAVLGIAYLCIDPALLASDSLIAKISEFTAQGQTQRELGNLSGRAEMWEKMWDSYWQSPWIGHGYFMTSPTGRIYVWGEWGNWTAHNLLLQLMVTLGAVGVILFVVGVGYIFVRVVGKLGSAVRSQGRLALFLILVAVWYLGWGTLNESIFGPMTPESVMFGLTLGLGAALVNQETPEKNSEHSRPAVGEPQ